MEFKEYADKAAGTDMTNTDGMEYYLIGLCGEVGELANAYKKRLRGDLVQPTNEEFLNECGDILWYLSRLADKVFAADGGYGRGYGLEAAARMNTRKLENRFRNGSIKCQGKRQDESL